MLNDINVTFTVLTGSGAVGASWTLTNGYYNIAIDALFFGVTSGGCPAGGNPTCLSINISGTGLNNTHGETVGFDGGENALGNYFNSGNSAIFGINFTRRRDLTFVSGTLCQIPAPLSALALLPLAGLKRYRRRVQRLSQAREAATSAAELG